MYHRPQRTAPRLWISSRLEPRDAAHMISTVNTVSRGKGWSVDVTTEKREIDALPRAGEAGAECEKSLLLSFSGRTETDF